MMFSYWSILGTMYLIFLTYQDYTNNRMVDDRKNYFMLGLSISILSHISSTLWYKLSLTLSIIILNVILKKYKPLGEADINTISWVFLGLGLMHYTYIILFTLVFLTLATLFYVMKTYVFKYKENIAFYGVILISFVLTCFFRYLLINPPFHFIFLASSSLFFVDKCI